MNRSFWKGGAAGLAIGLLAAVFSFQVGRAGRLRRPPQPVMAAPIPDASPGPAIPEGLPEDIAAKLRAVQANPKDREAWVALGNAFFDLEQPEPAIDAYERALRLEPNDPDVITDQGLMYVALNQYDKALENFQKANRLDPDHPQSKLAIGVAYSGLGDLDRAEAAWNEVIKAAPDSPGATQARALIDDLRTRRRKP